MIGIENVNEFYTNHYLAAILEGEVRPHLERWRSEGEASPPWRRLALLQQPFFRYKDQLDRVRGNASRVEAHQALAAQLLDALGYPCRPVHRELAAGPLPLLGAWSRGDGEPLVWLLAAPSPHGGEGNDVLSRHLLREQHDQVPDRPAVLDTKGVDHRSIETLVTDAFGLEDPPRFVLIVGDTEWVLADRGKWAEQRLLRFDWVELLGRRESDALEVVVALLHRETLAPESGTSLVDTLDDSSHKHAYEVSEDLKYALRDAIERIGNEAIRYRREVSKKKVYGEEIDGNRLAAECIRYMYRILFLLYIEARPELGYAPMGSESYRLGYSFERLRDLEMLELESEEAREGFYLDACLKRLFSMVYDGTRTQTQQVLRPADASAHHTFRLVPLRSHLFDPGRTPFLDGVKLRNEVLLHVIRSMSLSRPKGTGKGQRRGRISYATLGINQLGAVYEALLSFRGFFAEETLYEVKPADTERPDPVRDTAYFVPEDELGRYEKAERVFDDEGRVTAYPPGTFIYRMAGRDRQKSASYYTPEVLTKCLVKYALKELLEHEDGTPKHARAEDLLELKICEPAMGSAAFLNEAVNQLSERYLQRRQQELGERIPHDRYLQELQRVRMYVADNNVFGVDLNPVAIELAEVSLWLNAIFTEESPRGRQVFVPWFGAQLACGNSLVGAWRKVFAKGEVDAGKAGNHAGWLDAVPERVPVGTARPKGSVYHWLLPDRGMAVYGQGNEGKPIRDLCAAELAAIEAWRTAQCQALSASDRDALVKLSDAADRLWAKHTALLTELRTRTTDPLSVYGHAHPQQGAAPTTTEEKDRIWSKEMASEQVRASSPYRRLKLAMDYWCALWFWPIAEAELLPDRDEWLTDLALLLDKDVLPSLRGGEDQRDLFAPTMPADAARTLVDEVGFADVERLIQRWPRLRLADDLARRYRFHHWELEYADLFAQRGGFDLILGNPPWIRLEWSEKAVLGDEDPSLSLQALEQPIYQSRRAAMIDRPHVMQALVEEYLSTVGLQSFISGGHAFSHLHGVQPNLYKCFLLVSFELQRVDGAIGLVTDKGIFSDPAAGAVRALCYPRLRFHFQFRNQFRLFHLGPGDNNKEFDLAVYGRPRAPIHFVSGAQLLAPSTIDESITHSGIGSCPSIKDEKDAWDIRGHRDRLLTVRESDLRVFSAIFDEPGTTPTQARLPSIFSRTLLDAIRRWATNHNRVALLAPRYTASVMFDETKAVRDLGLFRRETFFATTCSAWVVSGPHFFVANPSYKTPRSVCDTQNAYDSLDLQSLPADYLPRSNFALRANWARVASLLPRVPWADRTIIEDFRLVFRRQLSPGGERTLVCTLVPPEVLHLHSVLSLAFMNLAECLDVGGMASTIVLDFYIKATGRSDLYESVLRQLPMPRDRRILSAISLRFLGLCSTTTHYAPAWLRLFERGIPDDRWSAPRDSRLPQDYFANLTGSWGPDSTIRPAYARRFSMVEMDVLAAQGLGLSLRELQDLYRIQFPVMRQYERDTWYDSNGRIVFTNNGRGLSGVGLPRQRSKDYPSGPYWTDVCHMSEEAGYTGHDTVTQVVTDDTLPGGPRQKTIVYQAPWVRCDRERDYEVVWKHFAERFGLEGRS